MIDKLLEIAWASYMDYWEQSKEQFFKKFNGFTLHPITNQNRLVGCIATRDNEIHIYSVDKYNLRKYVKSILVPMLDEYGEVRSTVHVENYNSIKFVAKLGFKAKKIIGNTLYIRITKDGLCW